MWSTAGISWENCVVSLPVPSLLWLGVGQLLHVKTLPCWRAGVGLSVGSQGSCIMYTISSSGAAQTLTALVRGASVYAMDISGSSAAKRIKASGRGGMVGCPGCWADGISSFQTDWALWFLTENSLPLNMGFSLSFCFCVVVMYCGFFVYANSKVILLFLHLFNAGFLDSLSISHWCF